MKQHYLAAIVTPFHNTDMNIFRQTAESVMCQTVGFENIEWIIVLHNCAQEYLKAMHEMLDPYENIVIKELFNDAQCASSPRNYALPFISAPYVEFLDSDDRLAPDTIRTCLKTMKKHRPDLVIFRMAYIKENDSVAVSITDKTLWNPLVSEIVLEGKELKRDEIYCKSLASHPHFYRTEFLKENNLSFPEDIPLAEDVYFILQCYTSAKKMVVLPGFVGHYYYINSGSTVQRSGRAPKQILSYAYGFKKIFDLIIDNKLNSDINPIFLIMLRVLIGMALSSQEFSVDDWKMLQAEMAPYKKYIKMPPVTKLFPTIEEATGIYTFVTQNLFVPKKDPVKDSKAYINGEQKLIFALKKNQFSDFGRYYHFDEISSVYEYQE